MQFIAAHNLRDTGAVASSRAAEIYGLEILMDGIQVLISNSARVCMVDLLLTLSTLFLSPSVGRKS